MAACDENGWALHKAIHSHDIEKVKVLLEQGADARCWTSFGYDALEHANRLGYTRVGDVIQEHFKIDS